MHSDTGRTRARARTTLSVAGVLLVAGLLFTANARLARGDESRHPQNLSDLVEAESSRVEQLAGQVDALRAEVEALAERVDPGAPTADPRVTTLVELHAGTVPVTGPGLVVTLKDAPASARLDPDVRPDDLVVHQQDLQAVVNALWAGGAEAMTLQDQRVTSGTAFRCVGNVLSLHGRVYSPPYVVRAIGDPAALRAALDESPQVGVYLDYVDAVGLGWSVAAPASLTLPAYEGSTEMRYATVPDDVQVLP